MFTSDACEREYKKITNRLRGGLATKDEFRNAKRMVAGGRP